MSRTDLSFSSDSGKWLCLLFINTLENYRVPQQLDEMPDYPSWVGWSARHGLISSEQAEALARWGEAHPDDAMRAMSQAHELRLQLFRLVSARAAGAIPTAAQLEFLNKLLPESLSTLRLTTSDEGVYWHWPSAPGTDRMVWPVVHSTAQLLTNPQCQKLRQCGGHKCTWLFIDESRNKSRRWCDMKVCGNRAKSRRHYQRARKLASS